MLPYYKQASTAGSRHALARSIQENISCVVQDQMISLTSTLTLPGAATWHGEQHQTGHRLPAGSLLDGGGMANGGWWGCLKTSPPRQRSPGSGNRPVYPARARRSPYSWWMFLSNDLQHLLYSNCKVIKRCQGLSNWS